MRLRRVLVALMALALVMPAASAYGAESGQEVNVHVLPADTLGISVDGRIDFGGMELGETRHSDFWMSILNTTSGGWEVTVTGGALYSFNWEGCDEKGCWNPIPTEPLHTIPKSNLVISGGDLDWWGDAGAIVPFFAPLGDDPMTILQATPVAHGDFGLDNPRAWLELTIPGDAAEAQYRTDLVYTIMPWTAP